MLMGYGLALAILRELYLHWRDAWREPDSFDAILNMVKDACFTSHENETFPLNTQQKIRLTRQFMRRDRQLYGPSDRARLYNIAKLAALYEEDMNLTRAAAWYEYGLKICHANKDREEFQNIGKFKLACAYFYRDRNQNQEALRLIEEVLPLMVEAPLEEQRRLGKDVLLQKVRLLERLNHQELESSVGELLSLYEDEHGPVSQAVLDLLIELATLNLGAGGKARLETHRRLLEEAISVQTALGEESLHNARCLEDLARFYSFKQHEQVDFSTFKQSETNCFRTFKPPKTQCFCTFKQPKTDCFCTFKPPESDRFSTFKRSKPSHEETLRRKAAQIKAIHRIKSLPYQGFLDDMELAASFYEERNQGGDSTTAFQLRRRAQLIRKGEIKVRA